MSSSSQWSERHHGVKFIFRGTRDSYKLVTNSGRSFCDNYVQISVTNTGLIVGKDSKAPNEPDEQISTISEYATENSDYDDRHIRRFPNVDLDNFGTPEVKIKCEPRSGEETLRNRDSTYPQPGTTRRGFDVRLCDQDWNQLNPPVIADEIVLGEYNYLKAKGYMYETERIISLSHYMREKYDMRCDQDGNGSNY